MVNPLKKFSFWQKVKAICLSLGVGSEIALFSQDAGPVWKVVVGVSTVLGILIANIIEDKNNNDIIDILENKPKD